MRIDIQGRGFPLTAPLLDHTQRRLRFALTRNRDRITRVVVRVGVSNVPRGGDNRYCHLQVYLQRAAPVLIEDSGPDLYAVIDRVSERAGRNVVKRIDRLHENVRLARLKPLRALLDDASGTPSGDDAAATLRASRDEMGELQEDETHHMTAV